ncbi:MAG TPA: hypothetical protein VHC22_15020 [Pirellulales bacterium]|nr:hypothetical protein [Pirellulales bacterium]
MFRIPQHRLAAPVGGQRLLRRLAEKGRVLACCGVLAGLPLQASAAETTATKQTSIEREYADELERLAGWCDERKLTEQAGTTRRWIVPQAPLTLVVALADARLPEVEPQATAAVRDWTERFCKLRQTHGARLFELAESAAAERDYGRALQLIYATLREDPDHEEARRLLGYTRHEGTWLTRYELSKSQGNQVWHDRYGWLKKNQVAKYEAGQRFLKGRWISAKDDTWQHADIDQGWLVATEHYQVRTNHSLEEGVRLAARLEEFYDVWRQIFARYEATDEQLARLFRDGAPAAGGGRRTTFHVTCYRDREEYVAALRNEHPNIGLTTGYYLEKARMAYFFAGPEADDANLYHEATHQLFSELRPGKSVARDANFWVIEGIACFMESYRSADRLVVLGGVEALRLRNARTRLLRDGFYLGLADLCKLGMEALQRHEDIAAVYSEAAGMTYFLMFAADGRFRQPLVDYLTSVYTNSDRADTLAELTGFSYKHLDEQYQHFIQNLP